MTTVTPPPPPTPPTPAPTPAAPVVTASASPEVLARLAALQVLEARVTEVPTRTQIIVESPAGPVTLRAPQALPLAEGARLTLQVLQALDDAGRPQAETQTSMQMRLTAMDGRPLGPQASAPPVQAAPTAAAPVQWAVAQRPAALSALLVQAPAPGAHPAGGPAWPVGTELTVRIASVQPAVPAAAATPQGPGSGPGPGPVTPAQASAPAGGTLAAPGSPPPAAGTASPPAHAAPTVSTAQPSSSGGAGLQGPAPAPGTSPVPQPVTVQGTAPQPASAHAAPPQAAPTQAVPQAVLAGTVQPQAAGALPLISTPAGTVALQAPVPLPPGATVVLEVTGSQPPAPQPAAPQPLPLPGGPAGAAFTQGLSLLAGLDIDAARRMAAALPAPDGRLLTNAVAFAQAASTGDVRTWVGPDALRILTDRGGPRGRAAVQRMADGLRESSTLLRDGSGAEWRVLSMPFGIGGAIERIQIITRRRAGDSTDGDEGDGDDKAGGGQRFLIQLDLSRLGALQLDGFYKSRDRRLDLVVRTKSELPQVVRRDIAGIFATSAQALALKGAVTFQVSARFAGPQHGDGDGADPTSGLVV